MEKYTKIRLPKYIFFGQKVHPKVPKLGTLIIKYLESLSKCSNHTPRGSSIFLHIITGLPAGGAETFLLRIVMEGAARGHCHRVVNLGGETPLAREIAEFASIVNLDVRKHPVGGIVRLFRFAMKWRKGARSISGWMYYGAILSKLFSLGTQAQKLAHIRHTPISISNESARIRTAIWILKYLSRYFCHITYNSEHSRKWHEDFGFFSRRSYVTDNGYPNAVEPDFSSKRTGTNPFVIGAASRNHPMKNQIGLLAGFAKLLEIDPDFVLFIAGKGTEELADTPEFQEVSSKVTLFGEISNMDLFYEDLDIFVSFSSWGESFQNVVAEAMLHGVPALATDIGAARRIVIDDACLLPVGNEDAFTEKVLRMRALYLEKTKWISYRRRCYKRISHEFSIARAYDQLLQRTTE